MCADASRFDDVIEVVEVRVAPQTKRLRKRVDRPEMLVGVQRRSVEGIGVRIEYINELVSRGLASGEVPSTQPEQARWLLDALSHWEDTSPADRPMQAEDEIVTV